MSGLAEVEARTPEEIMGILHQGNLNRTQQATRANAVSSRSHAILQVWVKTTSLSILHGCPPPPLRCGYDITNLSIKMRLPSIGIAYYPSYPHNCHVRQVVVESRDKAPGTVATVHIGKLSLVDLAGSERLCKTPERMLELQC